MNYIKILAFLHFVFQCYTLCKAVSFRPNNGKKNQKLEDDIKLQFNTEKFVRRLNRNNVHSIKKRSTCLNTLVSYTKHNCKDIISGDAENLAINNWPQAHTSRKQCEAGLHITNLAEFYNAAINIPNAAVTVVRVWNEENNIWQKIKVAVGYFCARGDFEK